MRKFKRKRLLKGLKSKIRKGIVIFLFSTAAAYGIILYFFLSDKPQAVSLNFSPGIIIGLIASFLIYNLFNILRVYQLAKVYTNTFTFLDSTIFTLGGVFLGLITPFQSGGIPLQLYLMTRRGISPGNGASLLFIRGVQSFLVFLFTLPFTLIFFSQLFSGGLVAGLIKYLVFFYATVMAILFFVAVFTERIQRFTRKLKGRFGAFLARTADEISNFKSGLMAVVKTGKKHFFISIGWITISLYACFSMAYFIVMLTGGKNDFFLAFNIQMLLTYLLAFVPTPGSSGFAEGGAYMFYSNLIPENSVVMYIFLWRLINTYLPAFIGCIIMFASTRHFFALTDVDS